MERNLSSVTWSYLWYFWTCYDKAMKWDKHNDLSQPTECPLQNPESVTVCSARLLWAWNRYNMNWDPPGSNHKAKPISNYQLSLLNTNPMVLRINRPANASLRYAIFIRNASRLKSTGISILKEQTHIQWHPVTDLPGSMWHALYFWSNKCQSLISDAL